MFEQVTTVEPNGNKSEEFSVDEIVDEIDELGEPSSSPNHPVSKFVYPGGSRPLDGYTIKRGIGHGGFGEIYYALSDAGKEVALKLIRQNLDIELRGIRHCLNLKHPNLLALYDIRQDNQGDTWVVMEYVSGGCLADALLSHPNGMPTEEALAWLHGIGAGVAYLHDRGIVHRDLKPGNLFSDEGNVKVGDYGLSKFVSCSRRSGQTASVGTVHYMAPEVANGRYGKGIDIYAMGVVLYEMLTGRVPFEGESVGEILMKHLTAKADVSMLAEPYRSVTARALEKDPAKRFASVAEMLAALPQPAQTPPGAGRLPSGTPFNATGSHSKSPPFAETYVEAERVDEKPDEKPDEEPIAKAVTSGWRSICRAWNNADMNTPTKAAILIVGAIVLMSNASLVPMAIMLLILYGVYRVVRMVVLSPDQPGKRAQRPNTPPVAAVRPVTCTRQQARASRHEKPRGRQPHHEAAENAMVVGSTGQRITELIGSMLLGALAAMAICVVMALLISYHSSTLRPEQFAWLVLMSVAGTWAVQIPSKFWEGTRGEPMLRRFVMMVIGFGLGAIAFCFASIILVDLPYLYTTRGFSAPNYQLPPSFYAAGRPLMMAYLACFGTLFLLVRWWRQANPLRGSRLSLWSLLVTVVVATLVAGIWHFPQPWLPMVAGAISVAVQLTSPWVHPRNRQHQSGR